MQVNEFLKESCIHKFGSHQRLCHWTQEIMEDGVPQQVWLHILRWKRYYSGLCRNKIKVFWFSSCCSIVGICPVCSDQGLQHADGRVLLGLIKVWWHVSGWWKWLWSVHLCICRPFSQGFGTALFILPKGHIPNSTRYCSWAACCTWILTGHHAVHTWWLRTRPSGLWHIHPVFWILKVTNTLSSFLSEFRKISVTCPSVKWCMGWRFNPLTGPKLDLKCSGFSRDQSILTFFSLVTCRAHVWFLCRKCKQLGPELSSLPQTMISLDKQHAATGFEILTLS